MASVDNFKVIPVSMVRKDGLQRIQVYAYCSHAAHFILEVYHNTGIVAKTEVALSSGKGIAVTYLPERAKSIQVRWILRSQNNHIVAQFDSLWAPVNRRTFYIMISSHTDIGLHNSQYIQRYNSAKYTDRAAELCDMTSERNAIDQYRYTIEGTWFWNNYGMECGEDKAHLFADRYIKTGKIGVFGGIAGNHTQVYGLEELCRSAYEKKRLAAQWHFDTKSISMIDNNGISMSIIQPYADAGYENLFFAPNHWNPISSSIWHKDTSLVGSLWNSNANGGGSRIDVRYDSELPMVFFWENKGKQLLVWCSTAYEFGGQAFGLMPNMAASSSAVDNVENCMADQLPRLDTKYPYSVWMLACYSDDQEPNIGLTDTLQMWNEKWAWPKLRTLGNPDEPFSILRECCSDQIPHLSGDITGGWYQHPLSTPELLAQKFEVDRTLPTAEKWACIAALVNSEYEYPTDRFRKAWDYLLFNDEHSYGTSGYSGRRVYETWMQHRDWIQKAQDTALFEKDDAINAIIQQIPVAEPSIVVFNPTTHQRTEYVEFNNQYSLITIPSLGYAVQSISSLKPLNKRGTTTNIPPCVENEYYTIRFNRCGALESIFDKKLGRELIDANSQYGANTYLYTNDNHQSYRIPSNASFEIITEDIQTTIFVYTHEQSSGAEIIQKISLPKNRKQIDFDNILLHVSDMVNRDRYQRYAYFAFPFDVPNCRRFCHLNGSVAEYATSITGHGTDVYMAAREWSCIENNEFGIALFQLDSTLVEFDHIHPDKTDYGNVGIGSNMFCYLANDWLQMHTPGGTHVNYRFRYRIVSYLGGYEDANIAKEAELYSNPVEIRFANNQHGDLNPIRQSFLSVTPDIRLTCLKRADDGNGLIARLYGTGNDFRFSSPLVNPMPCEPSSIDEFPTDSYVIDGFITCRLGKDIIHIREKHEVAQSVSSGIPAPIGTVYTGLISTPRAACGGEDGQLYLLWGKNQEDNIAYYNLYRGEEPDFVADEHTLIAQVKAEEYCVCRYEDRNLKTHSTYFYRVCAVSTDGNLGKISDVFSATTREIAPTISIDI